MSQLSPVPICIFLNINFVNPRQETSFKLLQTQRLKATYKSYATKK